MSLGFYLLGRFEKAQLKPNKFLRQLEKWIVNECPELLPTTRLGFIDEKPSLFATLHPAAEEVEIALADPNHITVSANTSTVGPGYHIFLCDLLRQWTDKLSLTWQEFGPDDDTTFGDETGYFFTRDMGKVYDHMERWLRFLTGSFFDGTMAPDSKEIALCMPMDVQFEADYLAITQLGPRDRDWLYRMSQGLIHPREFFPWYDVGLTAEYYLGRVLAQMWSDVRWRKPVNKTEARLLKAILDSLVKSYRLNSNLDFPRNEWRELLSLTSQKVPDFLQRNASGTGRIGYRRGYAKTRLPGNWRIKAEGAFSAFESDKEGSVSAFDPPREIWFTAYSFSADNPDEAFRQMRHRVVSDKHELVYENGKYVSVADITPSSKTKNHYLLQSKNIGILCRSICTLVFSEPADREWAIRVWRSLTPPIPATR